MNYLNETDDQMKDYLSHVVIGANTARGNPRMESTVYV